MRKRYVAFLVVAIIAVLTTLSCGYLLEQYDSSGAVENFPSQSVPAGELDIDSVNSPEPSADIFISDDQISAAEASEFFPNVTPAESEPSHPLWDRLLPAVSPKPQWDAYEKSRLSGRSIAFNQQIDLLDITFNVPAGQDIELIDYVYTSTFRYRVNPFSYGLSQFCPSLSFVFQHGGAYDSFVDIHIRRKSDTVGSNYSHLTCFLGNKLGERLGLHTEILDCYEDASAFFKAWFGNGEDQRDGTFDNFIRFPNEVIGSLDMYHYSYLRERPEFPVYASDVIECYGEQYLFETNEYIYLFAYSSPEAIDTQIASFQDIVNSISVISEDSASPPIWAESRWIQDNMTGDPKFVFEYVLSAEDIIGTLSDCITEN